MSLKLPRLSGSYSTLVCSLSEYLTNWVTDLWFHVGVIEKEEPSTSHIVYGARPSVRQQIRGRDDDDFEFDLE